MGLTQLFVHSDDLVLLPAFILDDELASGAPLFRPRGLCCFWVSNKNKDYYYYMSEKLMSPSKRMFAFEKTVNGL